MVNEPSMFEPLKFCCIYSVVSSASDTRSLANGIDATHSGELNFRRVLHDLIPISVLLELSFLWLSW